MYNETLLENKKLILGKTSIFTLYIDNPTSLPLAPEVSIIDLNSKVMIFNGTALFNRENYYIEIFLPNDSNIKTSNETKYILIWDYYDKDNNRIIKEQELLIYYDDNKLLDYVNDRAYVVLPNTTFTATLLLDYKPKNVLIMLYKNETNETYNFQLNMNDISQINDKYLIKHKLMVEDFSSYNIVFVVTDEYDLQKYYNKIVYVISASLLNDITIMKESIDKLQKTLNFNLGYKDYQYYIAYLKGLDYINSYKPVSTYTLYNIPKELKGMAIMSAEMSLLMSQYIAEGESSFNFSGQSVSLDIDVTGILSDAISSRREVLQEQLTSAKQMAIRNGSGIGIIQLGTEYKGIPSTSFGMMNQFKNYKTRF